MLPGRGVKGRFCFAEMWLSRSCTSWSLVVFMTRDTTHSWGSLHSLHKAKSELLVITKFQPTLSTFNHSLVNLCEFEGWPNVSFVFWVNLHWSVMSVWLIQQVSLRLWVLPVGLVVLLYVPIHYSASFGVRVWLAWQVQHPQWPLQRAIIDSLDASELLEVPLTRLWFHPPKDKERLGNHTWIYLDVPGVRFS